MQTAGGPSVVRSGGPVYRSLRLARPAQVDVVLPQAMAPGRRRAPSRRERGAHRDPSAFSAAGRREARAAAYERLGLALAGWTIALPSAEQIRPTAKSPVWLPLSSSGLTSTNSRLDRRPESESISIARW